MENENQPSRKTWDLMIGIALVIFGGLRLYNRLQTNVEWDFRSIFTIVFMVYGCFLIYRHFKNSQKN